MSVTYEMRDPRGNVLARYESPEDLGLVHVVAVADPPATGKVGVETLLVGDRVRAVIGGPVGRVVDPDRSGWTVVKYPARDGRWQPVSYKHGQDRLYHVGVSS